MVVSRNAMVIVRTCREAIMIKALNIFGVLMFGVLLLLVSGCAVMSKELRREAEKDLSFEEVLGNPELHENKVVIFGGVIVDSKNTKDGTLLEVLQKPLGMSGEPEDVDRSAGRFLALYDGFLDVAIYKKGREITVGGVVQGKKILPLGEIQYSYPVIRVKEIHLWPEASRERLHYPYWGHPYWGYPYWGYPYWDPLWHDFHRRPWYFHR